MDKELKKIEKIVLGAVFDFDIEPFEFYRNQINELVVKNREVDSHRYLVEFHDSEKKCEGLYGGIKVNDTRWNVSDVRMYAKVTVLRGSIKYLEICGSEKFFMVEDIGNFFYVTGIRNKEMIFTDRSSDRNLDRAIGFIPAYK